MYFIKTERLILREFGPLDAPALEVVFGDAEVMKYGPGVQTPEQIARWIDDCIQDYARYECGPWAVLEKSTHDLIGYCGLFHFADLGGQAEVELGYRLARASWGQGYATEAAAAARDYAFEALGLDRLVSLIDPENTASLRVAQKLGMRFEREIMLPGYSHPDQLYTIMKQQWREKYGNDSER